MTGSIFDHRTLREIYDEIRRVYLNDDRPWILGFSGGKDSTCMAQLVWHALSELPPEKLQKKIYIISSDTLIESPQIIERITATLEKIENAAKKSHLSISTNLLKPRLSDTFWVRLLGLGYPAPTSLFRWCTDMLKITNADRFIKERVSEYGEVIVLLGTRKSESSTRQQTMNLLQIENSVLSHHKRFAQTYVYTPLVDFSTEDVWNYLLQNKNPWGDRNRDLLALYQDANANECPLVVDSSTPSCGGGRFGCWTCTVVEKQKSLNSMVENGQEWMQTLVELREELKKTQEPERWPEIREITRRSGTVDLRNDGSDYTPGPYKLEFRKWYLEKLLRGQLKVRKEGPDPNMVLISEDEVHEIQRIWRMEQGDWQNSAYRIYEKVIGKKLESQNNDLGEFGETEQELLEQVCQNHQVPYKLVSNLLNAEFESQGATRHAKVFGKIKKEFSKEWRENIDDIMKELFEQRDEEERVKPNAFKKITLNDFGVYGGRNEFDFSVTQDKPIILCGGINGAGKTTLFESIMLCLYGQKYIEPKITQKQYNQKILRLFHRHLGTKRTADEASIAVEFQYAYDGKVTEYQVTRMWQNNHGKPDETLSIMKKDPNEENFSKLDSIEELEWQMFIDHLLPRGITKLFFFDGEKIQSIAAAGNEDKHIRISFDTLLGLDLVKQLRDDIDVYLLRDSEGETNKILNEIEQMGEQKNEGYKKLERNEEAQYELKAKINNVKSKIIVHEEKFSKLGGFFAKKREKLLEEKTSLEKELEQVEKEIRDLCAGTLPFSLIPKQLEELEKELQSDLKAIQNGSAKYILEQSFKDVKNQLGSSSFFTSLDESLKSQITKQISYLFKNKLDSISQNDKTSLNFSISDTNKILNLIDDVNSTSMKKIESLAMSHNKILDSFEKVKVGLDSAPRDDEIGPIYSELKQYYRELGELENELEHLKNLQAQEQSFIALLNSKIRQNLTKRKIDRRRLSGLKLAPKVQTVLEEYTKSLRSKKIELLERYILDGIKMLLHKRNFIEKITIDRESFEVKLFKGNDDEITKDMLSQGELQMYATAIVWGLAKTSGRPLPFIIDTPLARLDVEHREKLVENFYPFASHQTIILSTNSEITNEYHNKLKPYISHSMVIEFDSDDGNTMIHDNHFFDKRGEKIIEQI